MALLKLCPDMPLERKLPDGYRETWLEAIGNLSQDVSRRVLFATGANMGQRPFDDTAGDATEDALHFQLSSDGVHEIYIF